MKKKVIIGFMVATMMLSATACGSKEVVDIPVETKSAIAQELAEKEKEQNETEISIKAKNNEDSKTDKEENEEDEKKVEKEQKNEKKEKESDTEIVDNDDEKEESKQSIAAEWHNMEFVFEGNTYQLPVSYSEFEKNGWQIDWDIVSEDEKIMPAGELTVVMLKNDKYNEDLCVWATMANISENEKKLEECTVTGFEIEAVYIDEILENIPEMKLSKGITFGNDKNDVINAFGEADYTYTEKDSYTSFEYTNEESDLTMEIVIYDDMGVGEIALSNDKLYYEFLESHEEDFEEDYEEDLEEDFEEDYEEDLEEDFEEDFEEEDEE